MCGIAGLIHKGKQSNVGDQMTSMLQALKHRGPDSTGYAVYNDGTQGDLVMRIKVAEAEDMNRGSGIYEELEKRISLVDKVLVKHKVEVVDKTKVTEYALRYVVRHSGELRSLANQLEEISGTEILSIGEGLELIKDLGDAQELSLIHI